MELYVGGMYQGKLEYVLSRHPELGRETVMECGDTDPAGQEGKRILNHFHLLVKRCGDEEIGALLREREWIVISDEVGSGIIPAEKEERLYRERVGRWLCSIARRSDRFERIVCGIGQRLK